MPTFAAHAKTNLFLRVLARETSGYHQIETLFCLLDLHDDLSVDTGTPGLSLRIDIDGTLPGRPRDNLVWRAAESFFVRAGIRENAHFMLTKRIPAGAGLGGGSSDAAAAILALNALHGSPLGPDALLELGAALGSDVAFFVTRAPLAFAWSRGERLIRLPALEPRPAIVIVPEQRIATATAYETLDSLRERAPTGARPAILELASLRSWDAIERAAHNDFEEPAILAVPVIRDVLSACRDHGALIATVSGSGSACIATFAQMSVRDIAATAIAERFAGMIVETTLCGVDPQSGAV